MIEGLYETALNAGLPIISLDTSARILAVLYVHGNNEFMVHCPKFQAEIKYIQSRFHIDGGEAPDQRIIPLLRQYIEVLETFEQENLDVRYTERADKLFKERYGIKLIN